MDNAYNMQMHRYQYSLQILVVPWHNFSFFLNDTNQVRNKYLLA